LDSFTHVVLGAAIGHQLLNKKIGTRSLLYGAIIGSLPDIDILFGKFTDPITAIEIHRGFTHSVFVFLFLSPLLAYLIKRLEGLQKVDFVKLNVFVFLTLFTHAFLDVLTTWGTQLFWPIPAKLAIQSIFVADPMFTLPLIIGLMISLIVKKLKPNQIGLSVGLVYLIWGIAVKYYTLDQFEKALEAQKISYQSIQNKPSPLNSILWSANVMTKDGFYIGYYSLFDTQPIKFLFFPKNHALISAELAQNYDFKRLKNISDQWFTLHQANDQLYFNDLRFGMMGIDQSSAFVFSYQVIPTSQGFQFVESQKKPAEGKLILKQLWYRFKGN
jgi:inner membrane protein